MVVHCHSSGSNQPQIITILRNDLKGIFLDFYFFIIFFLSLMPKHTMSIVSDFTLRTNFLSTKPVVIRLWG